MKHFLTINKKVPQLKYKSDWDSIKNEIAIVWTNFTKVFWAIKG